MRLKQFLKQRGIQICCALVLTFFVGATLGLPQDIETYPATSIDASQGEATLFSHESVLLGLSCKSGPIGKFSGLSTVSIGDTLTHGKYSIRVGLIQVSKFNKDLDLGGGMIVKKGDVDCVLAASRRALPTEDDCDALWVRIVNCRPLK